MTDTFRVQVLVTSPRAAPRWEGLRQALSEGYAFPGYGFLSAFKITSTHMVQIMMLHHSSTLNIIIWRFIYILRTQICFEG